MQSRNLPTATPSPAVDTSPDPTGERNSRTATIVRAKRTYQAMVVPHRRRSSFAETLAEIA